MDRFKPAVAAHARTMRPWTCRFRVLHATVALIVLSALPARAVGQIVACESATLKGADTAPGDTFGRGIAIEGDLAVIGARAADLGEFSTGAVYVFERNGGQWGQVQKFGKPAPEESELFGQVFALSGATLVFGMQGDDSVAATAGAAYIFSRTNGAFGFTQKLTAFDAAATDYFGWAVAIQGFRLMIGAPGDAHGAIDVGSVYCYERLGPTWVHTQKLSASDGGFQDLFGSALLIDGERLFVGARDAGPSSNEEFGAVYVFERSAETWAEVQKLVPPDIQHGDRFGGALAVIGDTLFVGADGADGVAVDVGAVYVYRFERGSWILQQKIEGSEAAASDNFGSVIAANGATLVVGSSPPLSAAPDGAGADLYEFINDAWTRVAKLLPFGLEGGTGFGRTAAISSDTILIGAELDDWGGRWSGATYVFPIGVVDCNENSIADHCDIALETSSDWDTNGAPDECQSCVGDLNLSYAIDGGDIAILFAKWGTPGFTDLDNDGITGGADLAMLLGAWGQCVDEDAAGEEPLAVCARATSSPFAVRC